MRPGDVIDKRFEVNAIAGRGGMGVVYRAIDRTTHDLVAVKLLRDAESADLVARFVHEAKVLGEIDHPHVVRYVTHGVAGEEPYLVMEWLEGLSLAELLSRQALSIEESIELTRRVASALGAAHACGVVHRDIKPTNVFLQDGAIEKVKLLDFGIARLARVTMPLTATGVLLGTPGYMAPEQVRGDRAATDARADVFSLGCVLFECLTGKPAFQGAHVMALLAKLLMEDPRRVREFCPEVPAFLDELCASMLSKDPDKRPENGAAVVAALETREALVPSLRQRGPGALTDVESRLVSVIAVAATAADGGGAAPDFTQVSTLQRNPFARVRQAVAPFGAKVEELANGMLVVLLVGTGPATDQAAVAARCALRLQTLLPRAPIVLLTGRGVSTERLPVGEVFESAASLLSEVQLAWMGSETFPGLCVDEVTRALLDVRFDVAEHGGRLVLRGEREVGSEARTLLGKPSPFVGRDRELRNLLETIEDSVDERQASVMLVTGPAGMGKSRLRYELLRKVRASRPEVAVSIGRGDSMGAGSAFAMLASAFRSSLGISQGEPIEDQRGKLSAAVAQFVEAPERPRVTTFLAEMIGAPFPDEDDPRLRAARQDASIMASRIEAAYVDFVVAATRVVPVLFVLEDLQWGDAPSVRLIDVALREARDRPFVVVAFARPEVETLFPGLWRDRHLETIRLLPLSRRSAESLSRSMIGDSSRADVIATIVDRAAGNAFYLEELIRAVVEGRGHALPETVLGMVEARLAALSPEARRVLRAASLFGEVFWERGVLALLGEEDARVTRETLCTLCEGEVVVSRSESRFVGETEYAFRHALVREGTYAMLTERDRAVGHRVAGEWLVQAGEQDPMVLGVHFERGGVGRRAAEFYAHAAEMALRGGDLSAAITRAENGLACGPEADAASALNTWLGLIYFLYADYPKSYTYSIAAVETVGAEDPRCAVALGLAVVAALFSGQFEAFGALVPSLMRIEPSGSGVAATLQGLYGAFIALMVAGKQDEAFPLLQRILEIAAANPGDLLGAAWTTWAQVFWLRDAEQDPWRSREYNFATISGYEAAGARQYRGITETICAWGHGLLGLTSEASEMLDRLLVTSDAGNLVWTYSTFYKSQLLLQSRELEQARELADRLGQSAMAAGDHVMHANARFIRIECLLLTEKLEEAERALAEIAGPSMMMPYLHARYLSLLGEVRRHQGRFEEAVKLTAEAVTRGKPGPRFQYGEDPLLLRHAEILHASGDLPAARRVLTEAKDDLLARAEKIPDLAVRRSFLENIPHNRRTLALARDWLGDAVEPRHP